MRLSSVAVVLAFAACAAPVPQAGLSLGSARAPIRNGIADPGDPAVVEIYYGNASCTGELIGPQTILTAGHCTDDSEINPNGSPLCTANCGQNAFQIVALFGSDEQTAISGGKYIVVDAYEHHPALALQSQGVWNDIGVMHLASKVMQDGTPEPAPMFVNRTPV